MDEKQQSKKDLRNTIDELGDHFSALLGPLGQILDHMREQNERAKEQLEHSARITKALQDNNKRLVLLLVFVGICIVVVGYIILRMHLVTLQLEQTKVSLDSLQEDLQSVLSLSRESNTALRDTKREVKESRAQVTLESRDGGVSVVVRPTLRKSRSPDAARPVVAIPVKVPEGLEVEEEIGPKVPDKKDRKR